MSAIDSAFAAVLDLDPASHAWPAGLLAVVVAGVAVTGGIATGRWWLAAAGVVVGVVGVGAVVALRAAVGTEELPEPAESGELTEAEIASLVDGLVGRVQELAVDHPSALPPEVVSGVGRAFRHHGTATIDALVGAEATASADVGARVQLLWVVSREAPIEFGAHYGTVAAWGDTVGGDVDGATRRLLAEAVERARVSDAFRTLKPERPFESADHARDDGEYPTAVEAYESAAAKYRRLVETATDDPSDRIDDPALTATLAELPTLGIVATWRERATDAERAIVETTLEAATAHAEDGESHREAESYEAAIDAYDRALEAVGRAADRAAEFGVETERVRQHHRELAEARAETVVAFARDVLGRLGTDPETRAAQLETIASMVDADLPAEDEAVLARDRATPDVDRLVAMLRAGAAKAAAEEYRGWSDDAAGELTDPLRERTRADLDRYATDLAASLADAPDVGLVAEALAEVAAAAPTAFSRADVGEVRELLDHDDPGVRADACRVVGRVGMLDRHEAAVRTRACRLLGQVGEASDRETLERLTDDDAVALAAREALERLDDPEDVSLAGDDGSGVGRLIPDGVAGGAGEPGETD